MSINTLYAIIAKLTGPVTNETLEALLDGMALICNESDHWNGHFPIFKGYSKHIENFNAVYVFCAKDNSIYKSAIFSDGRMTVCDSEVIKYNVRVTFHDANSFWKFLYLSGHNVVNFLLEGDLETDGNINYFYKFAYMSNDLLRRMGIT